MSRTRPSYIDSITPSTNADSDPEMQELLIDASANSSLDTVETLQQHDHSKRHTRHSVKLYSDEAATTIPATTETAHFVPAWEGLRGIAVLMTVFSHNARDYKGQHEVFGRGGVAIFFVLSGYLITGVLKRMQAKNISGYTRSTIGSTYGHVNRFLVDRLVRLYPAVTVMLVVTASALLYTRDFHWPFETTLAYQVIRTLSYTSDFENASFLWMNTWSLAVEEQFYIVWAFAMPLLVACPTGLRTTVMVCLIGASYAFMVYCEHGAFGNTPYATYNPFSNVYKLLFGATLQLFQTPRWMNLRSVGRGSVAALLALIAVTFSGDYHGPVGSLLHQALLIEPFLSLLTAIILLSTQKHGSRLLEVQPLRFVGRVSYAFYLYQSPLTSIAPPPNQGYPAIAYGCMAFVAAAISSLYIEEPIRQHYRNWRQAQQARQRAQ